MNLHNIAGNVVSGVNPWIRARIKVSTGSTTAEDGTPLPAYKPERPINLKVQSLSSGDMDHISGLNIQGEKRALYLTGDLDGVSRPDKKGGDIVTLPDGSVWLVICILENWHITSNWVKVAVVLQNDGTTKARQTF